MTQRQTIRPLPARVAALPGEALASLLRRTAAAMGYEGPGRIRRLITDAGEVPTNVNLLPAGRALDRLAGLLRLSPSDLHAMTFHCSAAQLVLAPRGADSPDLCDSKTILRYFATAASPVCPCCLQEDDVPYERLAWSFRALPICATHQCLLLDHCPSCRRPLRYARPATLRCACGFTLANAEVSPVSSRFGELVGVLRQGLLDRAELLPQMSTAATFWWAERLVSAAAKTPAWLDAVAARLQDDGQPPLESLPWLAAAEMLSGWPNRLEEFLGVFQRVTKHRSTSTGVSRRFGLLLREAAHLEQLGYSAPADALRHYLLRHYAAGHLNSKVCLFRDNQSQLANRPWITQTEAAKRLHLRKGAIGPLIARGVLIGEIHSAGARGRSLGLVSRSSVESLRNELGRALSVRAAAKRLGIGRNAVLDFIHQDLLPRAVRTANGWKIPMRSVEGLESLCANLQPIEESTSDWVSLRQATRSAGPSGLTMSRLLQWIRADQLQARVVDRQRCLNGIVVSQSDLETAQRGLHDQPNPASEWSLHRTAQKLFPEYPMKPRILQRWIEQGLLQAGKKGRRTVISADQIERFRAKFCLAQEATKLLGVSRSTLSRWEVQGRIVPVYGKRVTPGAGFSLYRRADLQRLIDTRS